MHVSILIRSMFLVFALHWFSNPVFAQSQPSLEAYAERPEIDLVALSESGDKVAMVVRSSEKMTAEVVVEGRVPPRFKRAVRRLSNIGNSYYITKFVIHDQKSGKTRSLVYPDFNNVIGIDFVGEDHLFITTLKGSVIVNRRGKSRAAFHERDAMVLSLKDMEIRSFFFEEDLEKEPSDRRKLNVWSILAQSFEKNVVYIHAFGGEKKYSKPRNHVFRANLDTGAVAFVHQAEIDTIDWFVSQEGRILAREDYDNRDNTYRILSLKDGELRERFKAKKQKRPPFSLVGLHPERESLIILDSAEHDFLAEMDASGTIGESVLARGDRDIDDVYVDANRVVEGVRYAGALPSYSFFDADLNSDIADLIAEVPGAAVSIADHSGDWNKILLRFDGGFTSGMYVLYDRKNKSRKSIVELRPDIGEDAIGESLPFEYLARDGLKIEAIATVPPGTDLATVSGLKTIVMPHGGPEAYDAIGFDWMAQYFANRGYLVLQPNFRGSSGYGTKFTDAGNGEWGRSMQDDITDGLQALVDAQLADPNRVCIVGASYGGYAALAGGAFTPELYKCIVAIAPVSDLHRMLKQEKRDHGRNHWVVDYWEERMADGEAKTRKLNAISPARYARSFEAPVLLVHGDRDSVVPLVQSEIMRDALEDAGRPVEFVLLEEGDHWLSESPMRMATLEAASSFVDRYIGSGATN